MLVKLTRLLTVDEHDQMNEEAISRGFYRDDRRIFLPGMAWLQPWYFDPSGERERLGKHVMVKLEDKGKLGFLSSHYWRDWAHLRPPMIIVCPNGGHWEIDRKSSNGEGWQVSGDWPNITCAPSIIAGDYHGFLRNGEFTADLDGKSWPIPNPYEAA